MVKTERQRYVSFKLISPTPFQLDVKLLADTIWRNYYRLFGEVKSGKAGFWIVEYDENTGDGIIRCSHEVLEELITTMTLITDIDGTPVSFDTVDTSGTIKSLNYPSTTGSAVSNK